MSRARVREEPAQSVAAIDHLEVPELSVLARLAVEAAMNMRRFGAAANLGPPAARKLHQKLTRLGLLETDYMQQGALEVTQIRLSPQGHELAALLLPLDQYLSANPLPKRAE